MGWSDYKSFVDMDWGKIPKNPGVYYIRCANKSGKPINIQRLGGVDKEGIIYVGETGSNLRNRLRNFWENAKNRRANRHRAGWNYSNLGYIKKFPLIYLEVCYMSCGDKEQTGRVEAENLREYRKEFIDLPPLNFSAGREKYQ
jgi:hypothetical protein